MLTIEDKVKFIQEASRKHHISAYEYGTKTTISTPSAQRILEGSGNPRNKTLNIMIAYIEQRIVGAEKLNKVISNITEADKKIITNTVVEKLTPLIEAQNEKITTLRNDFKLMFDQFLHLKNEKIKTTSNKKKSS